MSSACVVVVNRCVVIMFGPLGLKIACFNGNIRTCRVPLMLKGCDILHTTDEQFHKKDAAIFPYKL